jgi:hypothetical protein
MFVRSLIAFSVFSLVLGAPTDLQDLIVPVKAGCGLDVRVFGVSNGDLTAVPDARVRLVPGNTYHKPGELIVTECGEYSVEIVKRGFESEKRIVQVQDARTILFVSLKWGIPELENAYFVSGTLLRPVGTDDCDVLIFVPVLRDGTVRSAYVGALQQFGMKNLPYGVYSVLLVGPAGVCGTGTVKLTRDNRDSVTVRIVPVEQN